MKHKLLLKLCLILVTGLVAFFYLLHLFTLKTEESMSFIADADTEQLQAWGAHAESLYKANKIAELDAWLGKLKQQENTWVSVAGFSAFGIAGEPFDKNIVGSYHFGRSVEWKIHLYFAENPIMEIPFQQSNASLLIKLPDRMRPGSHWTTTKFALQIIMPMLVLLIVSVTLYRHIVTPLQKLDKATSEFSRGNFSVRVARLLGNRNDEFSQLAHTFDKMASRIGELINNQRQLISDLSHELRTPLTRLDIAVENFDERDAGQHLARIARESNHIRKLVDDSLTLAWLDNENPQLQLESVDLVDLLDVLVEDARFEFTHCNIALHSPTNAVIENSSHRALCAAIENVIRNACRYTPKGKTVSIQLQPQSHSYELIISDQGPGIPNELLEKVFEPFFRVDDARAVCSDSFGLGLALAKRHLASIRATIKAVNNDKVGLSVVIMIPIS